MTKARLIDLDKEQLGLLESIIKSHIPDKTVWAYGSRVTWKAGEASDLDLVAFGCNSTEIFDLKEAFEESDLLMSVDVMNWETIPEKFKKNIRKKHVVLQEKQEPKGWRKVKLEEVVKSNCQSIGKNYPNKIIQYLDTGSITKGKIESLQSCRLSEAPIRAKRLVKNKDIVYSTVRPIQRHYGFMKNPPANLVVSTGFSVIETVKTRADPSFIYYLLTSQNTVERFDAIAEGSTSAYPSLKPSDIEGLEIFLPPLPEQKAIAEVLSSLDDKIDLLHRQNKTLEDMAQTLFRQWFIEEADKNWKEISLEKFVKCTTGHSYKSTELQPSSTALVTLKNFARDGSFRMDGYKEFVGRFKDNQIVKQGDLVVSHTDITQEADIIGNPVLVVSPEKYNTLVMTMDLMKVESTEEWLSKEFLLYTFKSRHFKNHCLGCSNGTTVLHMSRKAIPSYKFRLPNKEKIKAFTKITKPKIEKTFVNIATINVLENLRDIMLPKLVAGTIRIKKSCQNHDK